MGMAAADWIDPFGAAEFYCDDMRLEEVSPGIVRVRMLAHQNGELILRCTLIMPAHVVPKNIARSHEFLQEKKPVSAH